MGLTLTNEQIDQTYAGLIKMNDNVGITGVLKPLSDGLGTDLPFEVSTTGVNFTGTVTGIDAVQTIVAGTNVTVDATDPANPIVSAAGGGGGGGSTPPMTVDMLPAIKSSTSTRKSYRNGETVIGYTFSNTALAGTACWKVMPMAEADTISTIYYNIATANGTDTTVGIYELTTDADGEIVMGTLLKDCGTVSAATSGDKFLDLTASPFVMPAGATYGAVGIMIGNTTPANSINIATWSGGGLNSAWSNGTENVASGTVYRAIQRRYNSWTGSLPTDASAGIYASTTSSSLMLMVSNN